MNIRLFFCKIYWLYFIKFNTKNDNININYRNLSKLIKIIKLGKLKTISFTDQYKYYIPSDISRLNDLLVSVREANRINKKENILLITKIPLNNNLIRLDHWLDLNGNGESNLNLLVSLNLIYNHITCIYKNKKNLETSYIERRTKRFTKNAILIAELIIVKNLNP